MTNAWTGWQYRPLKLHQVAERDALIRIWLRVVAELAERRLVRCLNFTVEQRWEQKIPYGVGLCRYDEDRTMTPLLDWASNRPVGQWSVEASIRVDQEDRGDSKEVDAEVKPLVAEGKVLRRLFGDSLAAATPKPLRKAKPKPKKKVSKKAKKRPVKKIASKKPSVRKPNVRIIHGRTRPSEVPPLAAEGPVQQSFMLF